jgi:pimeloyl-ACP methyl ester carboxylesterase
MSPVDPSNRQPVVSSRLFSERSVAGAALALCMLAALFGSAAGADARTTMRVCGDHGRLTCGRVSAPLDPSGRVPGRVSLFVERYATVAHPSATLVALAGGPGQSGVATLGVFRDAFSSILRTHALVTFDERGVGRSGPLDCPLDTIAACARRLGVRARFYSSDDTVSDIEAIRRALGLGRIDLYGVSYGTFPATQYARRYPSHLAHLVLDSTVPADGDLDVKLNSFASIRRQLGSICITVCPGLDPTGDLDALLAGLPRTSSSGLGLTRGDAGGIVLDALYAADFDPLIRASIPAALRLGAGGDRSAVLRLGALAVASDLATGDEGEPAVGGPSATPGASASSATPAGSSGSDIEDIATRCEDERFVWSAGDSPALRALKVLREEARLPPAEVAPFPVSAAFESSGIDECERWPTAGDHPAREPGRLPDVPTLILSGADDVRTPLEQATALAAEIPGSTLLAVPGVGHAVLSNDSSGCAERALDSFLASAPVSPCSAGTPSPVDPLPPSSLAALAPAAPLTGEPGEVLTASVLTLRHDVGLTVPYAVPYLTVPGTVAGGLVYVADDGHEVVDLIGISYVRSVTLTGLLGPGRPDGTGRLVVDVGGHAYGTLHLAATGAITGRLGGRSFELSNAERQAIDAAHLGFVTQLE